MQEAEAVRFGLFLRKALYRESMIYDEFKRNGVWIPR